MAHKFEVGKTYEPYQTEFAPVKVIRRTAKTIWVDDGETQFSMRVKTLPSGDEYATDSKVPPQWRDAFTYSAVWEYEGE